MTTAAATATVVVPGQHLMASVLGPRDANLRRIEQQFARVRISARGNEVRVSGDDTVEVAAAVRLFEELVALGAERTAPRHHHARPGDRHGPRRRAAERGAVAPGAARRPMGAR